jgi:non-homologous end joining protein Ku
LSVALKAKASATEAFEIRAFVKGDGIDFLYFGTRYYLAPVGKSGIKAAALLRDALEKAACTEAVILRHPTL